MDRYPQAKEMMKIRTAQTKDIELMIPLILEYEKASEDYLPSRYKAIRAKKRPLNKHIKLALEDDMKKKNSRFLVAEDEHKIVGYIYGEIRDDSHKLYKSPKTGELNDLAVLKGYQNKKVASKLWDELQRWFVSKRCIMITLSVNIKNKHAQEVYKKWGFDKFYLRMIKRL